MFGKAIETAGQVVIKSPGKYREIGFPDGTVELATETTRRRFGEDTSHTSIKLTSGDQEILLHLPTETLMDALIRGGIEDHLDQ